MHPYLAAAGQSVGAERLFQCWRGCSALRKIATALGVRVELELVA